MSEMRIYTPESVDLQLDLAGLGSRCIAFGLDFLLQLVLTGLIAWALYATEAYTAIRLDSFGSTSIWVLTLGMLLLAVIWLGLPLVFEVIWRGQTIGKRVVGLRVVAHSGLPAGLWALVARNLLRAIDALPGLFTLGCAAIWLSPKRQRLGDLAAGTVVIRERRLELDQAVPAPQRPPTVALTELAFVVRQLDSQLLAATRSFLAKRARLERSRRLWLADRLALQVAVRGAWRGVIYNSELFLEDVMAVRSGQWTPDLPGLAAVAPPVAYWRAIPLPGGERYRPVPPETPPATPDTQAPSVGMPSAENDLQ